MLYGTDVLMFQSGRGGGYDQGGYGGGGGYNQGGGGYGGGY